MGNNLRSMQLPATQASENCLTLDDSEGLVRFASVFTRNTR